MTPMPPEKLWTVTDVAEYLGVTERTVRTWQRTRRLPYIRIGGTIRFSQREVEAWVAGRHEPCDTVSR
jgi:excisionase family DNA binding protein